MCFKSIKQPENIKLRKTKMKIMSKSHAQFHMKESLKLKLYIQTKKGGVLMLTLT